MKHFNKLAAYLAAPVAVVCVLCASAWGYEAPNGRCPAVDNGQTVMLPNPDDYASFFVCSNGVPILYRCPDGLHFNAHLNVCDWPQNAECEPGIKIGQKKEMCDAFNDNPCETSKGGKGTGRLIDSETGIEIPVPWGK